MKLLVVKTTSMGDVVHTLPAITDMAAAIPGVSIDWLVELPFKSIVSMHPEVRRVIPMSWRRWRKTWWQSQTRREMALCREQLRSETFDMVIDFQGLLKSAAWAMLAPGPLCGYDRHSIREPLASLFYSRKAAVSKELHAVERCRRLAAAHLGYRLPESAPDFGLRPTTEGWRPASGAYAVLIPCASRVEKRWPIDLWRSIVTRCHASGLTPVVLWGSADERQLAQEVVVGSGGVVPPFLTVADAAGLLAGARMVVGLDTGFTHLAAALARPTVGIYCDHEPGLAGVTGAGFVQSLGGRGRTPSLGDVEAAFDAALEESLRSLH